MSGHERRLRWVDRPRRARRGAQQPKLRGKQRCDGRGRRKLRAGGTQEAVQRRTEVLPYLGAIVGEATLVWNPSTVEDGQSRGGWVGAARQCRRSRHRSCRAAPGAPAPGARLFPAAYIHVQERARVTRATSSFAPECASAEGVPSLRNTQTRPTRNTTRGGRRARRHAG